MCERREMENTFDLLTLGMRGGKMQKTFDLLSLILKG